MLSNQILNKLNEQINLEQFSYKLYLLLSSWYQALNLDRLVKFSAKFNSKKSSDVNESNGEFGHPVNFFKQISKQKLHIASKINKSVMYSLKESIFASSNFQKHNAISLCEEKTLFKAMLNKINMVGIESRGLFTIGKYATPLWSHTGTRVMT